MTILIDKTESCWTVRLDRADKRNALSSDLTEALIDIVDEATSSQIDALFLRGEGASFCAGFDFTGIERQSDGDLLLRFVRIETLLKRIAAMSCLTVAFVHGRSFGAGVDLAAACSMRIAAPGAEFRMPGLKFGLVLGSRRFASIVGARAARALLETSATFDAATAARLGFVDNVIEVDSWVDLHVELVERARALDRVSRQRLHCALHEPVEDADMSALVRSASEPSLRERIGAYLGKTL